MKQPVHLGDLARGRTFWYDGRRYKVVANLGPAGVSVRSLAEDLVRRGGRTFKATRKETAVWSAGSPVEVEVRGRKAQEV